jgi:hypothetical protein
MNETDIKHQVKDYLDLQGFFHFPIMQGLGSMPGLPDRIAISKNGIVIFLEIKAGKNKQSDYQIKFEKEIKNHNGIYLLIYSIEELIDWIENNNLEIQARLIK